MGNTNAYFIALCIVVATVGQCFAATGNEIREGCQISLHTDRPNINLTDASHSGVCIGTVGAILDLGTGLAEPYRFCHPTVTIEQAIRVLLKYLDEHPELTHLNAVTLGLRAFKAAWPCH